MQPVVFHSCFKPNLIFKPLTKVKIYIQVNTSQHFHRYDTLAQNKARGKRELGECQVLIIPTVRHHLINISFDVLCQQYSI